MQEELAEEIASLEDEMAIYHNEHSQIMDALRVVDGLIAVKRKQELMEDSGIIQDIEEMDREEVVDALKREDVQEMIRSEKWSDLRDLFRGDLNPTVQSPTYTDSQATSSSPASFEVDAPVDVDTSVDGGNSLSSCSVDVTGDDNGGSYSPSTTVSGDTCEFSVDNNDDSNWEPGETVSVDI
ncbi:hypothetical protein HRED_08855, partial [Candidatus Haloredivivus sp. G17]